MLRPGRTCWLIVWLVGCAPHAGPDAETREVVREVVPEEATDAPAAPGPAAARPLQDWMKSELLHRIRTQDFRGLVRSLDALAAVAPADYPRWATVAAAASRAASNHDVEGVRRGCAACHQQYRARYRSAPIDYDVERLIERTRW
jgi:hypothetical protein